MRKEGLLRLRSSDGGEEGMAGGDIVAHFRCDWSVWERRSVVISSL